MNRFITKNTRQTQKLGELLAKELRGGEIICLAGELGSGKTTFAQGILMSLKVKGPYTSPTFLVMKHYKKGNPKSKSQYPNKIQNIYHIDVYRVGSKDILDLGWREIAADRKNVIIVEWAEKIKPIIPSRAIWIKFSHFNGQKRIIGVNSKFKKNKNVK